jgi:hypothetical protein
VAKGLTGNLDQYSTEIYKNIGVRNYGESIGTCMKNTVDTLQNRVAIHPDFFVNSVCLEMTLHGDPALKVNYFSKPDYAIKPTDIYFTPENVTTQLDTFTINIVCSNIGRAIDTIYFVDIQRKFPDDSILHSTI